MSNKIFTEKSDLSAAFSAGAAAVDLATRTAKIAVPYRGLEFSIPLAFDASGQPVVLDGLIEQARSQYDRENPERSGDYTFHDLASLSAWAKRHGNENTVAYVASPARDPNGIGKISVVIDGLPSQDLGSHEQLRGWMALELSDRLKVWKSHERKTFTADNFNDFIQRASDELGNAELISMVNNIEVTETSQYRRTVDAATGAIRIQDENTKTPARIPPSFSFAVPVFDFDDVANVHAFTARLSVKLEKGKPFFSFEIVDLKPRIAAAVAIISRELGTVVKNVYAGAY